jgi:ribosomal protein S18 acetylase RimI-like enzyme
MTNEDLDREPGTLETDRYAVRTMRREDLEAVVEIDRTATGRRRTEYFNRMIERALDSGGVQISLVAEAEGRVVGVVVGTVFYGEFGMTEPGATIDAIGVDPEWRRRKVGDALMRQLTTNLGALGVTSLRSEVRWDNFDLLAFFRKQGFTPGHRLCVERPLDPTLPDD